MQNTRHRFLIYGLIGLIFGIIDYFYLEWLAHASWGSLGESVIVIPIIIILNYGIWLVPIIPVAIYETRQSDRIYLPMLAGILTWSCALFSYYVYYATLLSLGKLIHLEHLNIFGDKYETFWPEFWQMFNRIILGQFIEWMIIALIGGAIIGALAFWFIRKTSFPRLSITQEN